LTLPTTDLLEQKSNIHHRQQSFPPQHLSNDVQICRKAHPLRPRQSDGHPRRHSNITTLSVPFSRFGHLKIGGRGTIVKLSTGSLAVFSPVALTPEVKSKVSSLGSVKYLVAPDIEHHIFLKPWATEYPAAEVIGMEGLPEKREQDPDDKGVKFTHVFSAGNKRDIKISPEFDAEFEYEYIHAHQNKELVFVHKPSRTPIEADVIFNLPATEQYSRSGVSATAGTLTKNFGSIMNTRGNAIWQQRLVWYGAGSSDRKSFADSVKLIKTWDFDRLIPCHGDVIETGGKTVFNTITKWFAEGTF
jgi:hypothetical protein